MEKHKPLVAADVEEFLKGYPEKPNPHLCDDCGGIRTHLKGCRYFKTVELQAAEARLAWVAELAPKLCRCGGTKHEALHGADCPTQRIMDVLA